ncbi:MAG TPA: prephenate dehydratase [Terriglobales bacterium]|jgi:prephenate dehydratase|nr:prephenate dehydratase [Terriglobales bacterium]
MKVAIQGEAGSFSHEAAKKMLPGCSVISCARSMEVFDRLERGSAAAAVIPIENSLAGSVAEHFDLLLARRVFIQSEFRLRIVHNLIAPPGVKRGNIRRAYSHPVALDQCRDFFQKNLRIQATPFYDTAGSVKHVIETGLKDAAGIAGKQAATVYRGKILAAGIEDDKQNFTRFFLLRKTRRIFPGANKTSIAFGLKNLPGALYQALSVFAVRNISMSKIESRPMRGRPWEYVFYVDYLRGDDQAARSALRDLAEVADMVKVLGIYPSA